MDEKTASIVKRARDKAAEYNTFADKVESGEIEATEIEDGTLFCVHHPKLDQDTVDKLERFFRKSRGGNNRLEVAPLCPGCNGTGYKAGHTCVICDGQG